MSGPKRSHVADLRGATRLLVDATRGVTEIVAAMQHNIAGGPSFLGSPLKRPVQLLTAPVYWSIHTITRGVGATIDVALEKLAPLLGGTAPGTERDAILAALNGVLGDYLEETENPLAIEMELRHDGEPLPLERASLAARLPNASSKLLVLLHGSSMSERQWLRRGHDHGAALARDLGYTPVHLRYNSGRHISTNGRAFAEMLEQLVSSWPAPLEELTLLGHSMGGLVARSACHAAEAAGHTWTRKLRALVCLGTPHHGAPLERIGHLGQLALGVSEYSAPLARLGRVRSAGVTDLRRGFVLDEHWEGRDRFARGPDASARLELPAGVACYAIAGTKTKAAAPKLASDGLVPVDSALGRHVDPRLALAFPADRQWIAHGVGHLDLLDDAAVYEKLREWLLILDVRPRDRRS